MDTRLLAAVIFGALNQAAIAQSPAPSTAPAAKIAPAQHAPFLQSLLSSGAPQVPNAGPKLDANCYRRDDGISDTGFELSDGGDLVWMMGFEAIGGSDVITEVSLAVGRSALSSSPPAQPAQIAIWDDPTNDLDPTDAVLLYTASFITSDEDTDIFNSYSVPDVAVSGVFFVGVSINHEPSAQTFPAPFDFSGNPARQAWLAGSTLGPDTLDLTNLAAADVPPLALQDINNLGDWLLRAKGDRCGFLGSTYCPSSANSVSMSGSRMSLAGSPSLGAMDLTLIASNAPAGQPGLFFYGPNKVTQPFGCGQICVGGTQVRLPVVFENSGTFRFDVDFAVTGLDFAALGTVNIQCWYRDSISSGCGLSFNLSDAIEITFTP